MQMPDRITVLWPDEQNWTRFREVCDGIVPTSLKAYRAAVAPDLESKEAAGVEVSKMPFNVDELVAFARRHGERRVTSKVRATFAAILQQRHDVATKH